VGQVQTLLRRLEDSRSRRVVFLSHCLLNENTRYLGGACRGGGVRELVVPLIDAGIGIVQMPCPEQRVWGGVLKRLLLRAYGARGRPLYRLRRVLLAVFIWYTRFRYRRLARQVARQVEDYLASGFSVVGIVGVDGSPSCGVARTLDLGKASGLLAGIDVESVTAEEVNAIIRACIADGAGIFTAALREELGRRGRRLPYLGHDLIAELAGVSARGTNEVLGRLGLLKGESGRPTFVPCSAARGPT
jgi:predicted secreted protein